MSTMLVVGSAPCLFDDVARAFDLRPLASIMLVNGACTALERAEHVLAGHEEKAEQFARERRARFPDAPPWRLHGSCHAHRRAECMRMFPAVTDWWPHEVGVGATSASKAAKLAFIMGCNEVILCGCPLDQPGYFEGEAAVSQHTHCARIGDHGVAHGKGKPHWVTPSHPGQYTTAPGEPMKIQEMKIIRGYRAKFKELADGSFKGKVFSMSGFTRDCLGEPQR